MTNSAALRQFTTESGYRIYWSEGQIASYKAVRAIKKRKVHSGEMTEQQLEAEAIAAGNANMMYEEPPQQAQSHAQPAAASGTIDSPATIYARRADVYAKTAGMKRDGAQAPATPAAQPTLEQISAAAYQHRDKIHNVVKPS